MESKTRTGASHLVQVSDKGVLIFYIHIMNAENYKQFELPSSDYRQNVDTRAKAQPRRDFPRAHPSSEIS